MEAKRQQLPSEILVISHHSNSKEASRMRFLDGYTKDGSIDRRGKPANKEETGGWRSGMLVLISEGFAAIAFTGVEANLVLFSKSVLNQSNASSAAMFSRWMGALNIFALLGAFLSDSYLGRYLTCAVFQAVIIVGLVILSMSTHSFLVKPKGCERNGEVCKPQSKYGMAVFYIAIYLIALGSGTMEPALGTFGADQFDEEDAEEKKSKTTFLSYYYVALNLGSLIAEIIVVYVANLGQWGLAFWLSAICGVFALVFLLFGNCRYRHFKPSGNTLTRFSQVIVASVRKMKLKAPARGEELFELPPNEEDSCRKILHTEDFKFLDRAAIVTREHMDLPSGERGTPNPWQVCTVTQVEEVKCVLRLIPIWFCTIIASIVFVQVFSVFVEQGSSMKREIVSGFSIPPASMTAIEIISSSLFVICFENLLVPMYVKLTKRTPKRMSELQRIGVGLVISIVVMIIAGLVEQHRRRCSVDSVKEGSNLSILWQIPQYVLVGVAEAFVIVGQWEFFVSQIPDGLKSMGLGLSISASAVGGYLNSELLSMVMKITTKHGKPGWVPSDLNDGHLDRFFFLIAVLIAIDLVSFILVAKRYKGMVLEKRDGVSHEECMP